MRDLLDAEEGYEARPGKVQSDAVEEGGLDEHHAHSAKADGGC
jgi:hypothetical protein